jgi:hypothetical protein
LFGGTLAKDTPAPTLIGDGLKTLLLAPEHTNLRGVT